jgi:uncharacterized ferredoxin-like protein
LQSDREDPEESEQESEQEENKENAPKNTVVRLEKSAKKKTLTDIMIEVLKRENKPRPLASILETIYEESKKDFWFT